MARGKKGGAAAKPPKSDQAKTATDKAGQISARKLKSLMAEGRKATQDTREIAGTLGQQIKDAVENDHLHKGAFAVIRKLDRMEPEKLADFLDTLDYYRDISGINERAAKVMRMDLEDDGGKATAGGKGTVHPFPTPKGEAAE